MFLLTSRYSKPTSHCQPTLRTREPHSQRRPPMYPAKVIPPPPRWPGVAQHISVADYEPEGLGVLLRLYYATSSPPPRLFRPRYFAAVDYVSGLIHYIIDTPKRQWWVRLLAMAVSWCVYLGSFITDTIPASLDAPPRVDVNDKKRLPVIVFSHGLAGNRNLYAGLLTSLASQGYLVAAIEHRDGSASCAARVRSTEAKVAVTYELYIHTDGNHAWRRKQIARRVEELSAAIEVFSAASEGRGVPRNMFPTSRFDSSVLDGVVDVSRLVAMGHSFGGATVMTAMGKNAAIKRVVLLDPWTEPLGGAVAVRAASIPTLVLNSHNWSRDQDLHSLYQDSTAAWLEAEVADTTHQDFSDLFLRMPLATSMFTKRVKSRVNIHKYYDFNLALLHLFFELTQVKHTEESGGGGGSGGGLAVALHEGAVELVRDYRGDLEIRMRSSASG